ncbi:MAG: gamma carbonic anhydrase family protein [Proteobacteria bacterium ST_bin11]|nr:MAG: gamma carbonic anhydrase family protein [Proteobacteria bacterium ST_bin11]
MAIRTYKGKHPKVDKNVYIDDTAIVIGNVSLGEDVSVWPTTVIRGDVEAITIGDSTNVQDGAVLHVSHAGDYSPEGHPLVIGKGVTIGHRAVLHACSIGDYCLIGIGAIVMDDAELGGYLMLGAGSLVPPGKKLEGGFLYVGTPAKQIRALTDSEKAFLEYSAKHYVKLKNHYLSETDHSV